jgi:hypothetical protein
MLNLVATTFGAAGRIGAAALGAAAKLNGCALAHRAFDFNLRAVSLCRAVHHRQAQASAALALGGEERFQATPSGVLIHADARVAHFDLHAAGFGGSRAQGERSAFRQRIHCIEYEVGERLANFALHAGRSGRC